MARACVRVCDQLKGAPSALLQGRVGVNGLVMPHSSREAERVCAKYVERLHEVSARPFCGGCERNEEVLPEGGRCEEVLPAGGRNEEVLPAGGRNEEVLPAGGRNEVQDERRKVLDEFLQRRILGVAYYWVWFATDFLAAIEKPPGNDSNTNAHVRKRNKALIAINEAVAPWMWIVFQLQGDARSRKISGFWKTPKLDKGNHVVYMRVSLASEEWYIGETGNLSDRISRRIFIKRICMDQMCVNAPHAPNIVNTKGIGRFRRTNGLQYQYALQIHSGKGNRLREQLSDSSNRL